MTRVLSASQADAPALRRALSANPFLVVGLCAAWCDTCTAFRHGFEALASARDDVTFVWLDIEDDADLAGDIDVENFPTIAVFNEGRLVHFGISLPQQAIVGRLLSSLSDGARTISADPAVVALPARLAARAQGAARVVSSPSPSNADTN
ncbi:MAG: thioredoxin family protein [Burkholderiaceae bacterium]